VYGDFSATLYNLIEDSKATMTWRQLHTTLFAYHKKWQDKLLPQSFTKINAANIPLEIKEKRPKKTQSTSYMTEKPCPSDKMTYKRISNKPKSKLRVMRTNSYKN
jgi:hypothetical protein